MEFNAIVDALAGKRLLVKNVQGSLFPTLVHVGGYTKKDGTTVEPHTAMRQKAPPEPVAPPKQVALFDEDDEAETETETKEGESPKIEAPSEGSSGTGADIEPEVEQHERASDHAQARTLERRRGRRPAAAKEPAADPDFEAAEDRQDIAEAMAKDPHSEEAKTLLAAHVEKHAPPPADPFDDLDPSSPNYRYRDTGYVGGSRKEMAAEQLRRAGRDRTRLRVTDVDWAAIEENAREAKELVVKGNLFGAIDWQELRATGMDPGAGFLISKVYSAVAAEPAEDTPEGRYDYALAITTLRDRLEACHAPDEVDKTLTDMRDERDGAFMNDEEAAEYRRLREKLRPLVDAEMALKNAERGLENANAEASSKVSALAYEISKRERRKWKVEDGQRELLERLKAQHTVAADKLTAYRQENGLVPIRHETRTAHGSSLRLEYPYRAAAGAVQDEIRALKARVIIRNQAENPLTRAWVSLGTKFQAILDYRSQRSGSDAFAKHMATVKAGRVKDWAWAEKEKDQPKGVSKRSVSFQLHVADNIERTGGRPVEVDSTGSLKDHFKLREVQSGNWVLDDPNAAKFHVEACAGAFADLADLLGVDDSKVSFNGRLAMAFGARGKGGKGAAAAHYEPVHRIINMTKMAGAGTLAHEWFHCVDNLVKEAVANTPSGADDYATLAPESVEHPEIAQAFRDLVRTMVDGQHRRTQALDYTEAEERWAKSNMMGYMTSSGPRAAIKNAADAQAAVDAVDALYRRGAFGPVDKKKSENRREQWRKIALIHHGANEERRVEYATGPGVSRYMMDAIDLDQGAVGKYWSAPHEMGARAFSAFVEDKLRGQGKSNTYLVAYADNAGYDNGRPYAEGDERESINAAMERLFGLIKDEDVLAKAAALFDEEPLHDPEVVTAS